MSLAQELMFLECGAHFKGQIASSENSSLDSSAVQCKVFFFSKSANKTKNHSKYRLKYNCVMINYVLSNLILVKDNLWIWECFLMKMHLNLMFDELFKVNLFCFSCHGYSLSDIFTDGLIKVILKTSTE